MGDCNIRVDLLLGVSDSSLSLSWSSSDSERRLVGRYLSLSESVSESDPLNRC